MGARWGLTAAKVGTVVGLCKGCRGSTGSPEVWGTLTYSFQIQCTGWWVLSHRVPITELWRKP